jgi:hypothetical protein
MTFCNKVVFYDEGLLAPRPTPKLEDHLMSFVHGYVFCIFTAALHLQSEDAPCCGDKGTHLTR